MVALVQRVAEASVTTHGETTGSATIDAIGAGLLILLGIHRDDSEDASAWLARKCARLRIFANEEGRMDRSLLDAKGEAMVVSQFTLYGDARKGNRPSFSRAAPPDQAEPLYEHFIRALEGELRKPVSSGEFGAMMQVTLVNDGPVTLWIER